MLAFRLKTLFNALTTRYKKILIWLFVIWGLANFGFGSLIGWFLGSKQTLSEFPKILPSDRFLIIAPHIDDEILSSAGLIQEILANKAEVKIVYLTNGDNNYLSVISQNKNFKETPNDFISLGEKRMQEAKKATSILGVPEENLIFLGYPDGGLKYLLRENFFVPYASKAFKFTYNPYKGTYKTKQLYTGINLLNDLKEIIESYSPNFIILPHPRDMNPDHASAYQFTIGALEENRLRIKLLTYLIHYRKYPLEKGLHLDKFIYPPKKLFVKEGWVSYGLTDAQIKKKLAALNQNKSQLYLWAPDGGRLFLESFVRQNEIFEEIY